MSGNDMLRAKLRATLLPVFDRMNEDIDRTLDEAGDELAYMLDLADIDDDAFDRMISSIIVASFIGFIIREIRDADLMQDDLDSLEVVVKAMFDEARRAAT